MPFYEYECQACGAHHEAMQKMSDAPLKTCPECGRGALVRLISAPVFRLKGGGWYETAFKSDKEKKRNLAGGEDKPSSDGEGTSARRKASKKPAREVAKPKAERAAVTARKKKAAKGKGRPKAKTAAKRKATAKRRPAPAKSKAAVRKVPSRKARR